MEILQSVPKNAFVIDAQTSFFVFFDSLGESELESDFD
jgi:hypothetical protein